MKEINLISWHQLCEKTFERIQKNIPYDKNLKIYSQSLIKKMLSYYESIEEYEKCAELYKFKLNTKRKKRITANKLTRKELSDLRMLGFTIPDSVKTAALLKFKNEK